MENKISKEHLEKLQELNRNTTDIKIQLAGVTVEISELESRKSHLITIHNTLAQQEAEFSSEIKDTYGDVKSINWKTGEFEV